MSQRFFVDAPIESDAASLAGPDAHHLANVMRAKPGDEVMLFDGNGCEFRAQVVKVHRATVDLAITARIEVNRELAAPLTLGVALPKGDRQRWLVEKAVELGVTRLVPLVTSRGVAQPTEQARRRLQRAVIEASKQCGRNRLMEIAEPQAVENYVARLASDECGWLADPSGADMRTCLADGASPRCIAVGPEGGFTDEEIAAARSAGWRVVSLGPRILRIETAAVAIVSLATRLA